MPIPGLSRNDMVSIQKREMRTEERLEKALTENAGLKAQIKLMKKEIQKLKRDLNHVY